MLMFFESDTILRPVKDWDQPNFTVFTMTCKHSYSKMKGDEVLLTAIQGSSSFGVAQGTSFSPAHQSAVDTPLD
jgi:hypothetical protein